MTGLRILLGLVCGSVAALLVATWLYGNAFHPSWAVKYIGWVIFPFGMLYQHSFTGFWAAVGALWLLAVISLLGWQRGLTRCAEGVALFLLFVVPIGGVAAFLDWAYGDGWPAWIATYVDWVGIPAAPPDWPGWVPMAVMIPLLFTLVVVVGLILLLGACVALILLALPAWVLPHRGVEPAGGGQVVQYWRGQRILFDPSIYDRPSGAGSSWVDWQQCGGCGLPLGWPRWLALRCWSIWFTLGRPYLDDIKYTGAAGEPDD